MDFMTEICGLAGVPVYESTKSVDPVLEGSVDVSTTIKALGDTDYRDKDAFFKMVQLLKGLAAASEKDAKAKAFLGKVSDALTIVAKGVEGD